MTTAKAHLLPQSPVESKRRNQLHNIDPSMMILVVVLHQQIVQQPRAKDPQERHHIGRLGVGEEDARQEGTGDHAVTPHKEEDDLEAVVGEAEELEVDSGAHDEKDGNVAAIDEEKPRVLDDPVCAVA